MANLNNDTNVTQSQVDANNVNYIDDVEYVERPLVRKGRGGYRPGSGRKAGKDKLTGAGILQAIANRDVPFEVGLAEDYAKARLSGDMNVIQKYQSMILNKVVADKQELDVTSNGLTIGASFVFPSLELPDWQTQQNIIDEPT